MLWPIWFLSLIHISEMNFNRFDFSDGNEIVGSMFAKCEMQLANFKGVELQDVYKRQG